METKKKSKKTTQERFVNMPLINPNAAGIDVGDTLHSVAVPAANDEQPVRTFGAMTCDLIELVEWLKKCNIETVVMESTGVYWTPLINSLRRKDGRRVARAKLQTK